MDNRRLCSCGMVMGNEGDGRGNDWRSSQSSKGGRRHGPISETDEERKAGRTERGEQGKEGTYGERGTEYFNLLPPKGFGMVVARATMKATESDDGFGYGQERHQVDCFRHRTFIKSGIDEPENGRDEEQDVIAKHGRNRGQATEDESGTSGSSGDWTWWNGTCWIRVEPNIQCKTEKEMSRGLFIRRQTGKTEE